MTSVRQARTPRTALYRIGRLPYPTLWPPWEYVGSGRFDDPAGEFRVLYATVQRRAAFVETLADFRPSLNALAALKAVRNADEPLPRSSVPDDWYHTRAIGRLRLAPRQRWLDLRAVETREALRVYLAQPLAEFGLADLDLGAVIGSRRQITQIIARWAYERDYVGVVYSSRIDAMLTCWAVFEGALFQPVGLPEPILRSDTDLLAVARLFGLAL